LILQNGGLGVNGNVNIGGNINVGANSSLTGNLSVGNNVSVAGILKVTNTTNTLNDLSGALVVAGGVGITGNIGLGGVAYMNSSLDSTSLSTGSIIVTGGLAVNKNMTGNTIKLVSSTTSTSTTTGALTVSGGIGVAGTSNIGNVTIKNVNEAGSSSANTGTVLINGGLKVTNTFYTGSTVYIADISSAALYVAGGTVCNGGLQVGGATSSVFINSTRTASTSTSTGSIIVSGTGGIGVGGNIYSDRVLITSNNDNTTPANAALNVTGGIVVNGNSTIRVVKFDGNGIANDLSLAATLNVAGRGNFNDTTNSTSLSTGSVIVTGGLAVNKNITGNTIKLVSSITSDDVTTGALTVSGGIGVAGTSTIGNVILKNVNEAGSSIANTGTVIINGGLKVTNAFYTGSTVYIASDNSSSALYVAGGTTSNGNLQVGGATSSVFINSTRTVSTTTSTGSIVVSGTGGIGVGGNVYSNRVFITSSNIGNTFHEAALGVMGGIYVGDESQIGSVLIKSVNQDATSTTTGTVQIMGGLSVFNSSYFNHYVTINNTAGSGSVTTGALTVSGGIGVAGTSYMNDLNIVNALSVGYTATFDNIVTCKNTVKMLYNLDVSGMTTLQNLNVINSNLTFSSMILTDGTAGAYGIGALKVPSGGAWFGGSVYIGGSVDAHSYNARSDYRIKENIKSLDESTTIESLNPVTYYNKESKKIDYGLIAHEVQEIFPTLVNGEKDGKDMQSVNYIGIIPLLINEIKNMKKEIGELKRQLYKGENYV